MRLTRRTFLAGAGSATLGALGPAYGGDRADGRDQFVSCAVDRDGHYAVTGIDGHGRVQFTTPLPARGHGIAGHPIRAEIVVFARRPGAFAVVLQTADGTIRRRIEAATGRHFYGHGSYSADGRLLFATENDYENSRGVLGIYDSRDGYRRVGEWASGGIGPHEVRLLPGGSALVVANGGIRTHPDHGRAKLNLSSMTPNLVYLDSETGRRLESARLPERLHKLSIRHIDANASGLVAVGMQYEGDRRDRVPLVGLHRPGGEFRLLQAPTEIARRMRHYIGSVAFDATGRYLASTGPRGHIVTLWDAASSAYIGHVSAADASGVAPAGQAGEFIVAGGDGIVRRIDAPSGRVAVVLQENLERRWDNHMRPAA